MTRAGVVEQDALVCLPLAEHPPPPGPAVHLPSRRRGPNGAANRDRDHDHDQDRYRDRDRDRQRGGRRQRLGAPPQHKVGLVESPREGGGAVAPATRPASVEGRHTVSPRDTGDLVSLQWAKEGRGGGTPTTRHGG